MKPCLIITGPTATGKTALAVDLARQFNGEIISADCRQVYRGLDLGTGKDLEEYGTGKNRVPCHLIDIIAPTESFDLFQFLTRAKNAMDDIASRGRLPIVAGGTPLYISALLNGYEMPGGKPDPALRSQMETCSTEELLETLKKTATPEFFARVDTTQRARIIRAIEIAAHPTPQSPAPKPLENALILAPYFERQTVRERIEKRLQARLQAGLVQEVETLHAQGLSFEKLDWFGLEYRFVAAYLKKELSYDDMYTQLLNHIRQFAKAQDVWFRKLERQGHRIYWLKDTAEAPRLVRDWLAGQPLPPPAFKLTDIQNPRVRG